MSVDENTAQESERAARERTRLLVNANDTKCALRNGISAAEKKVPLLAFESGKMRFNVRLYSFGRTGHRQYYFRRREERCTESVDGFCASPLFLRPEVLKNVSKTFFVQKFYFFLPSRAPAPGSVSFYSNELHTEHFPRRRQILNARHLPIQSNGTNRARSQRNVNEKRDTNAQKEIRKPERGGRRRERERNQQSRMLMMTRNK